MPAIVIGYGHVTFRPVGMMYVWHGVGAGSMTRAFVCFYVGLPECVLEDVIL